MSIIIVKSYTGQDRSLEIAQFTSRISTANVQLSQGQHYEHDNYYLKENSMINADVAFIVRRRQIKSK